MKNSKDTKFFENKKKEIFEHLKNNMILTETDSYRARILSTTTASSSAGPTNTCKGMVRTLVLI